MHMRIDYFTFGAWPTYSMEVGTSIPTDISFKGMCTVSSYLKASYSFQDLSSKHIVFFHYTLNLYRNISRFSLPFTGNADITSYRKMVYYTQICLLMLEAQPEKVGPNTIHR